MGRPIGGGHLTIRRLILHRFGAATVDGSGAKDGGEERRGGPVGRPDRQLGGHVPRGVRGSGYRR